MIICSRCERSQELCRCYHDGTTCTAVYKDPEGWIHRCIEPVGHDAGSGQWHDSGEWGWSDTAPNSGYLFEGGIRYNTS